MTVQPSLSCSTSYSGNNGAGCNNCIVHSLQVFTLRKTVNVSATRTNCGSQDLAVEAAETRKDTKTKSEDCDVRGFRSNWLLKALLSVP